MMPNNIEYIKNGGGAVDAKDRSPRRPDLGRGSKKGLKARGHIL